LTKRISQKGNVSVLKNVDGNINLEIYTVAALKDYLKLLKQRGGKISGGKEKLIERIKKMKK